MDYKIGHSYDVHRFGENRKLILGGVQIDYHLGLVGHSDADCVLHVVCEAIIGALGLGDLGTHFSDRDPKYLGVSSSYFVLEAKKMLVAMKYEINNLDLTIFAEEPLMAPYLKDIKANIANLLEIFESQINIKATRGEKLGFIGRGEGIASECVVLIKKNIFIKSPKENM